MARLYFASRLKPVAPPDGLNLPGLTVAEVLAAACNLAPLLRSYVFDEFGHLRRQVAVFVDHEKVSNDTVLAARLKAGSEIYVMQA